MKLQTRKNQHDLRRKLSDREVELIRQLHAERSLTADAIAEKFEINRRYVFKLVAYEKR